MKVKVEYTLHTLCTTQQHLHNSLAGCENKKATVGLPIVQKIVEKRNSNNSKSYSQMLTY